MHAIVGYIESDLVPLWVPEAVFGDVSLKESYWTYQQTIIIPISVKRFKIDKRLDKHTKVLHL